MGRCDSQKLAGPRSRPLEQLVLNDEQGWRLARRIVDSIELLHRRRLIDDWQLRAAGRYRAAVEACGGSIASPLNTDHIRGGEPASPSERHLWGAQTLRQAAAVLGHLDGGLVQLVAAEGRSIEEAAVMLFGRAGRATDRDIRHAGRRLREALTALAETWWTPGQRSRRL